MFLSKLKIMIIICVVEYEKGSAHRKYVLRKLQNKQKSGSPYERRFFALLHLYKYQLPSWQVSNQVNRG